jgi:tetratricopeptide (TPR) repeat protein
MPPNAAETADHNDKLLSYITAAMQHARYELSSQDGFYYGTIAGLDEVTATGSSREDCTNRLQLALAEWLLFRVSTNLPPPSVEGIELACATTAEKSALIKDLQQEILLLKEAILFRRNKFSRSLRRVPPFALANWNFVAFLLTLAIGAVIYFNYRVNTYLENIKTLYTSKETARKYSQLGDRLTEYGEIPSAEEAYNTALKLDPNNVDAISMIYILGIMPKPTEDYIPEIVDGKLKASRGIIEQDENLRKYLYIIYFFEGHRQQEQDHYSEAKLRYEDAIKQNPKFIYGYLAIAEAQVANGDSLDDKILNFEKVLAIDPNFAVALNNLGALYVVKEEFKKAIGNLEKSQRLAPYLESYVQLGDAYRYSNEFDQALLQHSQALDRLNDPDYQERYVSSSTYAFMPESGKSGNLTKHFDVDGEKKNKLAGHLMVINYELSLDYVLLKKYEEADGAFREGKKAESTFKLQTGSETTRNFFANRIFYTATRLKPSLDEKQAKWFEDHRK